MRGIVWLSLMLPFVANQAAAQDRVSALPPANLCQPYQLPPGCPPGTSPASPASPMTPAPNAPLDPNAPQTPNLFAGATEAGTQPGAMFNPNVFGDLIGIFGRRNVAIPGQTVTIPITTYTTVTTVTTNSTTSFNGTSRFPVTTTTTSTSTQLIPNTTFITRPVFATVSGIPITGQYSGFAISDDESPRPVDRVFLSYNYFSDVSRSTIPASIPSINAERQLIGFEKTFLSGDASVGVRLPFLQYNGFGDIEDNAIGDLSVIFKFAWLNDQETGDILSTGLVVTAPTGTANVELADGSFAPHATLIQPWGGFIYNMQQIFFQGFSSFAVPTDRRDPTLFMNSIAAGWWLYKNPNSEYLNAVVPVAELHVNTPLDHRSTAEQIYFQDELNATVGVYATFKRFTIGGAVGVPFVGPRPYNVEAIANINVRF